MIPIEVKLNQKITRAFRSFIDNYHPKIAVVINLKSLFNNKINSTDILIIPACLI